MRLILMGLAGLAGIVLLFNSAALALTVEKKVDQTLGNTVVVENQFFTMKIATDSGARIYSFIPKSDSIERVWWKNDDRSGLLDDHDELTIAKYKLSIQRQGENRAVISFKSPENFGRVLTKILTVYDDRPMIDLTYRIKNIDKKRRKVSHTIRSYWIAGGQAGPEDHYFWRGDYGVEEKPFPYGGVGKWHNTKELDKSWYAVVDTKKKTGLAIWVEREPLTFFYNWADTKTNPAIEYNVAPMVSSGEEVDVKMKLVYIEGLTSITDVNADNVFSVSSTSKGSTVQTTLDVYPIHPWKKTPGKVWMEYYTLDRVFLWAEASSASGSFPVGKVTTLKADYTAPVEGTYIMSMEPRGTETQKHLFEIPIVAGKANGTYFKGRRIPTNAETLTTISDEDIDYGYAMFWPRNNGPCEPIVTRELILAAGERETLEIGLLGLTDKGPLTLKAVVTPEQEKNPVTIRHAGGISDFPGQKDRSWASWGLFPGNQVSLNKKTIRSFWVTIDTTGIKPGRYSLMMGLVDQNKQSRPLAVTLDIRDVQPVNREKYSMVLYHCVKNIIGAHFKKHLELMYDVGVRQTMLYFNANMWRHAVNVAWENGKLKLDFGKLNDRLKPALDMGYKSVGLMYYIAHPQWLVEVPGFKDKDKKRRWEIEQEFARQLIDNFYKQGFEEVWFYGIEEPSVSKAMSKALHEELIRVRKYHPKIKIHMIANHYSRAMVNHLDPFVDIWTCTRPLAQTLQSDAKTGKVRISKKDKISFYTSAFFNAMPGRLRGMGWIAARGNFEHYTGFAYHQGLQPRQWVLYAEDKEGKPIETGSLVALREGFEDYLYLMTLKHYIRIAQKKKNFPAKGKQAVEKAQKLLDRIFSGQEPRCQFTHRTGSHGSSEWMSLKDGDYLNLSDLHSEVIDLLDQITRYFPKKRAPKK